jgi:hypothetical protein
MIRSPRIKPMKRDYRVLNSEGIEGSSPVKMPRKSGGGVDHSKNSALQSPQKSGSNHKNLNTPQKSPSKPMNYPLKSPPKSMKSPQKSPSKSMKSPMKSPSKSIKSSLKSPPKFMISPQKSTPKSTKSPMKSPPKFLKSPLKSPLKSMKSPFKSRPLFEEFDRFPLTSNHGESSNSNRLPVTPQKTPQKLIVSFYGSPRKTPQKVVRWPEFDDTKTNSSGVETLQVNE